MKPSLTVLPLSRACRWHVAAAVNQICEFVEHRSPLVCRHASPFSAFRNAKPPPAQRHRRLGQLRHRRGLRAFRLQDSMIREFHRFRYARPAIRCCQACDTALPSAIPLSSYLLHNYIMYYVTTLQSHCQRFCERDGVPGEAPGTIANCSPPASPHLALCVITLCD